MRQQTGRPQPQLKNRLPRGGNTCDFCGTLFVEKLYACQNFEWAGCSVFRTDTGRWAACNGCSALIDAGQWEALVTRVMQQVRKRAGLCHQDIKQLRGDLRLLYVAVHANMLGGALTVQQVHYSRHQAG